MQNKEMQVCAEVLEMLSRLQMFKLCKPNTNALTSEEDSVSSSDSDGEDDSPSDLIGGNFMKLVFGEENEDEELW